MFCHKFLAILFLLMPIVSLCQPRKKEFNTLLTLKKIGKVYRSASPGDTTWRTYLGVITTRNDQIKYHVLKEFFKIQAASTWHGHSTIYFFSANMKLKASFDAGMPDDLPYKLVHNTFYFHYADNGISKTYKWNVRVPLGKWFCTGPSGCDVLSFY